LGAKQFLEIEVVQQWESTFEGVTDLAWSDSDDAELAALRAEVERLRAAAQPALPHPAVPPEDDRSTGPPEGVVLDLGVGPDLDRLRGDRERLRRYRARQAREAG
jgi:hypothetical protein